MKQKRRAVKKKKLNLLSAPEGVRLPKKDLQEVVAQWESFYSQLRSLDELGIEKTEPATIFVWNR